MDLNKRVKAEFIGEVAYDHNELVLMWVLNNIVHHLCVYKLDRRVQEVFETLGNSNVGHEFGQVLILYFWEQLALIEAFHKICDVLGARNIPRHDSFFLTLLARVNVIVRFVHGLI